MEETENKKDKHVQAMEILQEKINQTCEDLKDKGFYSMNKEIEASNLKRD